MPCSITPHLTPANLVGSRFDSHIFGDISVALVGYCPRPTILNSYACRDTSDQFFIHVPPASVQILRHSEIECLSISHVYGGPVSSALVEELAYYGFKYVLAYGLAGGLGTRNEEIGDFYIVETALAMDGTTPHYTSDKLIPSDKVLNSKIWELADETGFPTMRSVQACTSDAIYREFERDLAHARDSGCDIVNCDSSHLFAVSHEVGISTTQCGVISDVAKREGGEWQSDLSRMLSSNEETPTPLDLAGELVRFYVETLLPTL